MFWAGIAKDEFVELQYIPNEIKIISQAYIEFFEGQFLVYEQVFWFTYSDSSKWAVQLTISGASSRGRCMETDISLQPMTTYGKLL